MKMQCPTYPVRPEGRHPVNAFLTPNDPDVIKVANDIANRLTLSGEDTLNNRVKEAFNFVSHSIEYERDKVAHGYPEFWSYPTETLRWRTDRWKRQRRIGDCEDTSFLLASLLLALRVPENRVRVVLGAGHAWVEARLNTEWFLLESTVDESWREWREITPTYRTQGYSPVLYIYHNFCEQVGAKEDYTRHPIEYY